jgi:hypothetical protein
MTAALDDEDIDLALRHLSRRFPEELARAVLPHAREIRDVAWTETQLTARQRRMDRGLHVVADGHARVALVEWELRWRRTLPYRMFEYHVLQAMALREAAKKGTRVPTVLSTVVLLSGRAEPWPTYACYRTSPRGERFSGVRFRIDAVYQRTLAELRARESALWMVFAPLVVDASAEAMPQVLDALRARVTRERFEELAVAMAVLADADARKRGLREAIDAYLPKELVMKNWIYRMGLESGIEQGIEQGIEKGIEKGREEGIEQGLKRGIKRGREHGRAQELRETLALTLCARGIELTDEDRRRIAAERKLPTLKAWFINALKASHRAEVFQNA